MWRELYRMLAVTKLPRHEWLSMTLREVTIIHDKIIVDAWDHTACLASMIHNLQCVVINMVAKSKVKPKPMLDFHPYRKRPPAKGLKITKDNFMVLKTIGAALSKR